MHTGLVAPESRIQFELIEEEIRIILPWSTFLAEKLLNWLVFIESVADSVLFDLIKVISAWYCLLVSFISFSSPSTFDSTFLNLLKLEA